MWYGDGVECTSFHQQGHVGSTLAPTKSSSS